MDDFDLNRSIERLRAAAASMTATRAAIEAGRPWPLHVVEHDAGPESTWGPTEVLAHVAEMLGFWLGRSSGSSTAPRSPCHSAGPPQIDSGS